MSRELAPSVIIGYIHIYIRAHLEGAGAAGPHVPGKRARQQWRASAGVVLKTPYDPVRDP